MNWGTKIIAGMVFFMLFIIAMVIYMFHVHGNDALVDEDYYEKGINYNQDYNALQNTLNDQATPSIKITPTELVIQLKTYAPYELRLMRPSTVKNDIKDKGFTTSNDNLIILNKQNMPAGRWFLELKWESNGKEYQFKKTITL